MVKLLLILILFVLAGGAAWYFLGFQQDVSEVPQAVQFKTIRRAAHGTGLIEGNSVVTHLKFPFAGIIDSIEFKAGETADLNEVVAKLNTTEIDGRIALAEIDKKEAIAKRDAVAAHKSADLIERAAAELKAARNERLDAKARLDTLKTPAGATLRIEKQEDAKLAVDRARAALNSAEKDLKQLLSHPTPHESEDAEARLALAKIRSEDAKRTNQNVEAAAAELRYALAEFDKVKKGPSAEDKDAAEARVTQARVELDSAETAKRRIDLPQPPPVVPAAEIERAEKNLDAADANLIAKQKAFETLNHDAESAETRAAEAAVERCEKSLAILKNMRLGYELRAPFKGIITKRFFEPSAFVMPNEDILWIVDFTRKKVRAEFDIIQLPLLKVGLAASVKSRAFGKEELIARVIQIEGVQPRTLLQGDPSQPKGGEVVEVLMEIDPPKDEAKKKLYDLIRLGLRVECDIVLESRDHVLSVPRSYVGSENAENGDTRNYVMKADSNAKTQRVESAHKQEVTCGMRDDYYVEILTGLNENDLVVRPKAQSK